MFFTQKRLKLYLGALVVLQVCTLIAGVSIVACRYIDFRTSYTAGYMLRTGHAADLYNYVVEQHFQSALVSPEPRALPLMTPPFTVLPFAPLSLLTFWPAYALFAAFNILLLLGSYALLKPFLATLSARWKLAPLLLFLSFLPAAIALIMGQLSFVVLLLYCACFVALRRKHDLLAGVILSFALVKFQIALPVAALFLLWRQWRFTGGFLIGGSLLTVLSIRMIGRTAFLPYVQSLFSMTHAVTADPATQVHFGIMPALMPNLFGPIFFLSHGAPWGRIVTLALSLALFAWTASRRPSLPLALLTAMLVSYHLLFYDLTLLLLPLPLVTDHLLAAAAHADSAKCNYRLLITQVSLAILFLVPFIRFLIAVDESFLLTLPILGVTVASTWWPALHGLPQPALAGEPVLDLAPAT